MDALQDGFAIDNPTIVFGLIADGSSVEPTLNLNPSTSSFSAPVEGNASAGMVATGTAE